MSITILAPAQRIAFQVFLLLVLIYKSDAEFTWFNNIRSDLRQSLNLNEYNPDDYLEVKNKSYDLTISQTQYFINRTQWQTNPLVIKLSDSKFLVAGSDYNQTIFYQIYNISGLPFSDNLEYQAEQNNVSVIYQYFACGFEDFFTFL